MIKLNIKLIAPVFLLQKTSPLFFIIVYGTSLYLIIKRTIWEVLFHKNMCVYDNRKWVFKYELHSEKCLKAKFNI